MPSTLPAAESSLDAIQRLASAGLPAQELLEQAAARIERVVPTDGWFMAATDPQTTLCIGTGLVRDLPAEQCQPHWDYEFLVPDYLKYADIVRSGRRVADLHDATGGRPERSPRFKQFSAATGFRSEVRVVFTVGDAAWGLAQLNRLSGRFTDEEKAWLERAAASIAPGLRRAMVAEPSCTPALVRGPGIVLSADVAPLIVEAYGLTGRELEVTRAIARGLSTAEIAAELYLSPHTVRDHVKALFEKVGVSSRGELVHRVFAEHYAAPSHQRN